MPQTTACSSCGKKVYLTKTSAPSPTCRECRDVHGSAGKYKRGCRCATCRGWQAARIQDFAARNPGRVEGYRRRGNRVCQGCGAEFLARMDGKGLYCSRECYRVASRSNDGSYTTRRGLKIARASRIAIYERDGWVCQICSEETDPNSPPQSNWHPTLDHVVPRSRGGSDDPTNLRTAHRWCNAVRGNLTNFTDGDLLPQEAA